MIVTTIVRSGSKLMNLDGSVTPKVFTYFPTSTVLIAGISVLMKDDGTSSFDRFGSISSLSNGILIQAVVSGSTRTIATIKDNTDLCLVFPDATFGNSATSTLGAPIGLGDSVDVFLGKLKFSEAFPLILTTSDSIIVTIQDNLSSIDLLAMSCFAIEG